jgi:hypothetical protein
VSADGGRWAGVPAAGAARARAAAGRLRHGVCMQVAYWPRGWPEAAGIWSAVCRSRAVRSCVEAPNVGARRHAGRGQRGSASRAGAAVSGVPSSAGGRWAGATAAGGRALAHLCERLGIERQLILQRDLGGHALLRRRRLQRNVRRRVHGRHVRRRRAGRVVLVAKRRPPRRIGADGFRHGCEGWMCAPSSRPPAGAAPPLPPGGRAASCARAAQLVGAQTPQHPNPPTKPGRNIFRQPRAWPRASAPLSCRLHGPRW